MDSMFMCHVTSHHNIFTYVELGVFIALVLFKAAFSFNVIPFIWGFGGAGSDGGDTEEWGKGVLYLGTDKKTN